MNTGVETLNELAQSWWGWVVHSTFQGLVVLAMVVAVLFLWRRASPAWRYGLLLIVLVKFALPPVGPSFGLFSLLPFPLVRPAAEAEGQADYVATMSAKMAPASSEERAFPHEPAALSSAASLITPEVSPARKNSGVFSGEVENVAASVPRRKVTPAGWVLVLQISGSLIVLGIVFTQAVLLRRRVRRAKCLTAGPLHVLASDVANRLGVRCLPMLYLQARLRSPQTGGLFRPFVLLPEWIKESSGDEQRSLIAHELAHLRRHDPWANWFQIAVQIWLWWNPFVWWLNSRIRSEREMCCDDLVLGTGIAEGESYSRTLLGMAGRLTHRETTLQVLGMADTFVSLKSRIRRALDARVRRPVRLSILSVVTLAAFAILVLPGSSPARWDDPESEVVVTSEEVGNASVNDADAEATEAPAPPRGMGRSFDGVDDFLEIPDSEALDIGEFYTVEAWVKTDHVTGQDAILSKEVPQKSGWTLTIEPPLPEERSYPREEEHRLKVLRIRFGAGDGDGFHDLVASVPQTGPVVWKGYPLYQIGVWRHVAVTWNRGKGTIYANGEPLAEDEFPGFAPARVPLRIGKGSADLGRHFNGELAEIRIWDVVRTPEEIEANMSKQLTGEEAGLVGYWPLDDAPGMVARDLSPYNRYARPCSTEETNYLGQKDFPRIVNLDPPNGAKDVDPSRDSITASFDRPMRNGYSWVDKGQRPKIERIEWTNDHECRAYVELDPGRDYALWLNFGPRTSHFRSAEGISSNRFYWTFSTAAEARGEHADEGGRPRSAKVAIDLPAPMEPINGCKVEEHQEGLLLTASGDARAPQIRTKEKLRPPFVMKAKAKTDSTNIRFYSSDDIRGDLIFNWELNPRELRVIDPITRRIESVPGKGYVTPNEWHEFTWEITPDGMRVYVDGEERYGRKGNYADLEMPLGIGPALGSKVMVRSFAVEPGNLEGTPETKPMEKTEGAPRLTDDVKACLAMHVTLTKPYPKFFEGSPTDKIAVQYAVIAVLQQVGLGYDWDTSYQNTNPICRQWIYPEIRDIPCEEALQSILELVGLDYEIADGRLILKKIEADEEDPTGTGAAPLPTSEKVIPASGQDAIPEAAERLGYVDDTAEGKKSLGASGHAVEFTRPGNAQFLEAVQIAASRYGASIPPAVDFHLYILDGEKRILADVPFPYALIERGDLLWYTLRTPSIEVPEQFFIALAFNPHQTKGVYLGMDESAPESHSYTGLPAEGFEKVDGKYNWMIRACLSDEPSDVKGTMLLRSRAEWSSETVDPFEGCIEVVYDDGESDGKQSYGGSGPAIRFRAGDFLPENAAKKTPLLKGFRLYASRYGSGYDPDTSSVQVSLIDSEGKVRSVRAFPYSLFSYQEKWVDLVFDEPVPLEFTPPAEDSWTAAFDPEAHRTKGIYFHYDTNLVESHAVKELSHSLRGTVDSGFQPVPDREWMIRAYLVVPDEG